MSTAQSNKIQLYKERVNRMSLIIDSYESDEEFFDDVTNESEKQLMYEKFAEEFAGEVAHFFQLTHELLNPIILKQENY